MGRSTGGVASPRCVGSPRRARASSAVALGACLATLGLTGCSPSTPLERLLGDNDAERAACYGPTFHVDIDVAAFECWRVVGSDDLEAFANEIAVALNGGNPPKPDRSFCFTRLPAAPEAVVACTIEFGTGETWFAVEVERVCIRSSGRRSRARATSRRERR